MEGRNIYSVVSDKPLYMDYKRLLTTLYTPMIGKNASIVYLSLIDDIGESFNNTLSKLCTMNDLDIDSLQKAIEKLEQFELLRTYLKNDTYLFEVCNPLSGKEFFNHDVYPRLYLHYTSKEYYQKAYNQLVNDSIDKDGFTNITHPFDSSLFNSWTNESELDYKEVRNTTNEVTSIAIDFDYEVFTRDLSPLKMPVVLRTSENMQSIGRLATIYCIAPEDMTTLVYRSIDHENEILDLDGLLKRCINFKGYDTNKNKNDYSSHPVAFLSGKQSIPVSSADKRLIQYLLVDCGFSNELTNYLLETTLENTNNKLSKSYVEKLASTWIRQKVDSIEKAKQANDVNFKTANTVKQDYRSADMDISDKDIEEFRRKLYAKEK